MAAKTINVGLIGTKFMGKAHSNAYLKVAKFFDVEPQPVMKAICGRHADETAEFAKRFGWESHESDWQKLCERKDIDVVDISTPGSLHHDMAVAAAKAGKHVFCEKPLAFNLKDAREMLDAARKAGVVHMVNFNYRVVPALALAKQMIKAGEIGEIRHFRATYLQDWLNDPKFPMNWRLRKDAAGSGANGDLNAHHVDMARFLVGEIARSRRHAEDVHHRAAGRRTLGRPHRDGRRRHREGDGRRCDAVSGEVHQRRARLVRGDADGARPEELQPRRNQRQQGLARVQLRRDEHAAVLQLRRPARPAGLPPIMATEGVHPFVAAWWPPGHVLGYEHTFVHAVYELMGAINKKPTIMADFRDGAQCVAVLDAVEKSIAEGKWAKVRDGRR